MKKQFTILVCATIFCFALNANAQLITVTETHQLPAFGDTVNYVDANSFGFDATGTGPVTAKVWDNSALLTTGTYQFFYVDPLTIAPGFGSDSFPSATIARGESGAPGYFYYQNTLNNINRIGWFNDSSDYGIYENGTVATEFHFPITAGQSFTSNYNGRFARFNVGEDSVKIESGSLAINADMQGILMLPTGTFSNVLRLHVLETFHIVTYIFGLGIQDNVVHDDYFYWFTDSVLQPLLISGVTTIDGNAQTPVLRYQPISIPTGIAQVNATTKNIYPNPCNGKFKIVGYDAQRLVNHLEIYNVLGEQISYSLLVDEVTIPNAAKGIYFVKIYSDQGLQMQKIVIE